MSKIKNPQTGEVCELIRDVRHEHPIWVHEQLETHSESELQDYLSQLSEGTDE